MERRTDRLDATKSHFSAVQVPLIRYNYRNDDIGKQKFNETIYHTVPFTTGQP